MYFAWSNGGAFTPRRTLFIQSLTTWRRQRKQGGLEALSPKHRGPKAKKLDPSTRRIAELERENNNLKQKLKQAETIIDVQKNSRKYFRYHSTKQERSMMHAAESLAHNVHVKKACKALGIPRASYYYYQKCKKDLSCKRVSSTPPLALSEQEQQAVLDILHSERFLDKAPHEIYATLLDEGTYLCSTRTMYRILKKHGEVRERRNQLLRPNYQKP